MINKNITLTLTILLLLCNGIKAQSNTVGIKKYVIFTFEIIHKESKVKDYYYWITPQDSIAKKNAFEVFPLYTEEYSKDILNRCKTGNTIDIFTASTATDFNFDDNYKSEVRNLLSLISINKVKIQDFRKRWTKNGDEVNIDVYASPIIGEFCDCLENHENRSYGFKGLIYLPVTSFNYDKGFWTSKDEKVVRFVDYSYVEYSSHYPSNIHGNSNIRVKSKVQTFK
ncbi:hypothetical protein [Mucilaginibacter sp. OK098]|uniref:hypothetical protein n=1 Tax=Mucilaginibacter sp. OK098 TaxID=1855297 RepID=UPI00090F90AF|nr:hypothetical protein [Mucilaginibacter sp. OK098]SHN37593.1 hypothetical protein SAMN05216524_11618 [Mucilaginibacter sp. OK098]